MAYVVVAHPRSFEHLYSYGLRSHGPSAGFEYLYSYGIYRYGLYIYIAHAEAFELPCNGFDHIVGTTEALE